MKWHQKALVVLKNIFFVLFFVFIISELLSFGSMLTEIKENSYKAYYNSMNASGYAEQAMDYSMRANENAEYARGYAQDASDYASNCPGN
jgi:hypothetical protein